MNNKFDKRINELYKDLIVTEILKTKPSKTGMDIATKIAADFDSKPLGLRTLHNKMTGGSGPEAKALIKQYNALAMNAAKSELDNMKKQVKSTKKVAV